MGLVSLELGIKYFCFFNSRSTGSPYSPAPTTYNLSFQLLYLGLFFNQASHIYGSEKKLGHGREECKPGFLAKGQRPSVELLVPG